MWELVRLTWESEKNPYGERVIQVTVRKSSPDHESCGVGQFRRPAAAFAISDVVEEWDVYSASEVVVNLENYFSYSMGEDAPTVQYTEATVESNFKETLLVDGRQLHLLSLSSLTVELLLKQGWEPISFEENYFPKVGGSTDHHKRQHVFRRPF